MLIFTLDILCLSSQDMFAVQFLPTLLLESFVMPVFYERLTTLIVFSNVDQLKSKMSRRQTSAFKRVSF